VIWTDISAVFVTTTRSVPAFFAVVIVDITDRKRAEEEIKRIRRLEGEMRQASRTEMMGGLTASLAHELNQPLQRSGLMRKLHSVCLLRTGRSCAR
jgi:C4-dicarboxylate-specific signal transduction histidine kinase